MLSAERKEELLLWWCAVFFFEAQLYSADSWSQEIVHRCNYQSLNQPDYEEGDWHNYYGSYTEDCAEQAKVEVAG
jgi:hypothetical protein